MKKNFLFLLIVFIILTGCSINDIGSGKEDGDNDKSKGKKEVKDQQVLTGPDIQDVMSKDFIGNVSKIAGGRSHSLLISTNNDLYVCGSNDDGQLGLGGIDLVDGWTKILIPGIKVYDIACGAYHSLLIDNNGNVWATGNNAGGQLGGNLDTYKNYGKWTQVYHIEGVIAIACGDYHSLLLKNTGMVMATGFNNHGQLGKSKDIHIANDWLNTCKNIQAIECGANHSLVLDNDGNVWSTGKNDYGQLGIGNNTDKYDWTQSTTKGDVISIAGGGWHSLLVKSNSKVYACGINTYGQLGLGSNYSSVNDWQYVISGGNKVVAGNCHSFLRNTTGELYACGRNYEGQLGLGLDYVDYVYGFSLTYNKTNQIACGYNHSLLINNNIINRLRVTGENYEGELGTGDHGEEMNRYLWSAE